MSLMIIVGLVGIALYSPHILWMNIVGSVLVVFGRFLDPLTSWDLCGIARIMNKRQNLLATSLNALPIQTAYLRFQRPVDSLSQP